MPLGNNMWCWISCHLHQLQKSGDREYFHPHETPGALFTGVLNQSLVNNFFQKAKRKEVSEVSGLHRSASVTAVREKMPGQRGWAHPCHTPSLLVRNGPIGIAQDDLEESKELQQHWYSRKSGHTRQYRQWSTPSRLLPRSFLGLSRDGKEAMKFVSEV